MSSKLEQPAERGTVIEQHSIDYVPGSERHGKVWHQGPFWFAGNFVLPTLVTRLHRTEYGTQNENSSHGSIGRVANSRLFTSCMAFIGVYPLCRHAQAASAFIVVRIRVRYLCLHERIRTHHIALVTSITVRALRRTGCQPAAWCARRTARCHPPFARREFSRAGAPAIATAAR